nr:formin-like protein 3 [Aegilops tauschii subsp. strangulata]
MAPDGSGDARGDSPATTAPPTPPASPPSFRRRLPRHPTTDPAPPCPAPIPLPPPLACCYSPPAPAPTRPPLLPRQPCPGNGGTTWATPSVAQTTAPNLHAPPQTVFGGRPTSGSSSLPARPGAPPPVTLTVPPLALTVVLPSVTADATAHRADGIPPSRLAGPPPVTGCGRLALILAAVSLPDLPSGSLPLPSLAAAIRQRHQRPGRPPVPTIATKPPFLPPMGTMATVGARAPRRRRRDLLAPRLPPPHPLRRFPPATDTASDAPSCYNCGRTGHF